MDIGIIYRLYSLCMYGHVYARMHSCNLHLKQDVDRFHPHNIFIPLRYINTDILELASVVNVGK